MSWAIETKGYSQLRACALVDLSPKTYRYASRRPGDEELRQELKRLADERRRFGYHRLHLLLRRQGYEANHKRVFRIYREGRLTVRQRGGRKRALGTRAPMAIPQGRNHLWSPPSATCSGGSGPDNIGCWHPTSPHRPLHQRHRTHP